MFSLERDTAVSLGELVSTVCCGQLQQAETLEVPVTEETPQWFSIFLFGLADSWAHRHESHLSENPGLRFGSLWGLSLSMEAKDAIQEELTSASSASWMQAFGTGSRTAWGLDRSCRAYFLSLQPAITPGLTMVLNFREKAAAHTAFELTCRGLECLFAPGVPEHWGSLAVPPLHCQGKWKNWGTG